ncbi:MAG: hypothetical protein ACRDTU_08170 [Micromonosporaceae bacterium]
MATRKQVKAARTNVKKAQSTARQKKTISKMPKGVREDLGRQGAKSRARGGRPGHNLEDRTRNDLYELAKKNRISGRSRMGKWELIDALRAAR